MTYRVFIVDDEPFIIEGLYDIVDWAGYGLEIVGNAGNGKDALELLRHTPADLLITDISMPMMDGLQLIRSVRELKPELKVIVLSGFDEFAYLKEGMRLGIENYLLKPINLEELKSTLASTVNKLDAAVPERKPSPYDIRILTDNVLYRWLTRSIAAQEFEERARLLQLKLDAPYVLIAVVRADEPASHLLESSLVSTHAEEGLPAIIPFRDIDGDRVLIIPIEEKEEGKRHEVKLLSRIKALVPSALLSLGSPRRMSDEAHLSYEEAKRAQQYFILYPSDEMVDYEQLPAAQDKAEGQFALDWSAYSKWIVAKDKEALFAQIDDDFKRMQQIGGMTPDDVRQAVVEMLIRFKMELQQIKGLEEPELFRSWFEQAQSLEHITELADTVKQAADVVVESLVQDSKSPIVKTVLKHIHESYAKELSLKGLGSQFHVHPVYLGKLFQKEVKESFTDYINKYRIEQAKLLLRESQLKVQDIAREVGYWEAGYFYKQFKKYVGISPMEYRELL
ncbi:response regulator transcription factor [Paenibacillus montanisoli]|uniref:DNA-binding response regulator n=1 Tax=Paenibacillus montanisoli TaxID=2081970 RepID=A0A328U591_9BACL|nr:response regulator transcription factor [Paenibacillus montanisoli]RAP75194.1 DNA-binding response regulator [Paenibacillus montanisoli]